MSIAHDSPFLRRFDGLWARLRRAQWEQTFALTGLLSLGGLGLLILLDFLFELPREARTFGIGAVLLIALGWLAVSVVNTLRVGTRPKTAAEIERAFPQLGQSVRTTVQFGDATEQDVSAAGVRSALVAALADDTHAKSRPLYLDSVLPLRRLWATASIVAVVAVLLLGGAAVNWEWRTASARALLTELPYTQIAVEPGNVTVDQGQSVEIALQVNGRTDRKVTLLTRPLGDADADWIEREFNPAVKNSASQRKARFVARLEAIKKPLEYRAVAGPAQSDTFNIRVRYPLALKTIEVELAPPAYTGHPSQKLPDGNITAVEGSVAAFQIELDQPPRTASLLMTDLARRAGDEDPSPASHSVPLEIAGTRLSATVPLSVDQKYSILAETAEGQRLPENTYRIRVRPDQAPEVYFEEPRDPLEVHTLAEVLMRIRVRDDFGLSKAGIVFEVNNEEEYPLLNEEFVTAAEELKTLGKLSPDTQAALEKVLPLEFFQLNQTDSVAYYAFAEDNYPGSPHRTVSDLRFIDIRPFRIRYQVLDPADANGNGTPRPKIATLEELINRQRFNLNRTMAIQRRADRNERVDLNSIDSLLQSETEIAKATRELADFLGGLMVDNLADEIQLLLQAEGNMLSAVDSLSAGKYSTAVLQERDALKELIEGRNRLNEAIFKNPKAARALAAADRRMAQKLRRPKSDKEEAEEVVRRLKQLEQQENQVQMALAGDLPASAADARDASRKPTDEKAQSDPKQSDETSAEDAGKSETPTKTGLSAQERRELQLDIVLEAQDVEKALGKLKNITDLAKSRMAEATKQAGGAMNAIERGDTRGAREQAVAAAESFDELARQVEGLIQQEAAEKLAAARNLANELAQKQSQLAMQTPGGSGPDNQKSKTQNPAGQGKPEDKPRADANSGSKDDAQQSDPQHPDGSGKNEKTKDNDAQSGAAADKNRERNPQGMGSGQSEPQNEKSKIAGLAKDAARNAETGKTVLDILQSVLKSTDPADKEIIAKVEALLKEQKLEETVARMDSLSERLRDGRYGDARVVAADTADRWEATALRLTTAFRELSAPKLEELLTAEQKLNDLRERLDKLQSERDVVQWHQDAGRLMEQLERLKIGDKLIEQLRELLERAGWTEAAQRFQLRAGGGGWILTRRGDYDAPGGYLTAIVGLSQELQAHIQELILGDLLSSQDEATPPRYEQLVERYYQVLAAGKNKGKQP